SRAVRQLREARQNLSAVHRQPHAARHLGIAHRSNSCGGYVEPERGSELSVVQLGFRFLFKAQPEYGRTAALADFANRNCRVGARAMDLVRDDWDGGDVCSRVCDELDFQFSRYCRSVLGAKSLTAKNAKISQSSRRSM